MLGKLCPVGGPAASFKYANTLKATIAAILSGDDSCKSLAALTFSIKRSFTEDEYHARLVFTDDGCRKTVSYVSNMNIRLQQESAEKQYDHESMGSLSARQLTIGSEFFTLLRRDIELSRQLDLPSATDWTEYTGEEERGAFHRRLGARPNSCFLNLAVEAHVTWPKAPTRVEFGGRRFVMFPATKENSQSISIDLIAERLSSEEARTHLNRFLTLLSWCDDRYAVLGSGWSGNPVPVSITRSPKGSSVTDRWIFSRSIPDDADLRERLAYYREGLNALEAGLATFAVLSFFKVFEIRGPAKPTKALIKAAFPVVEATLRSEIVKAFHIARGEIEVEEYIYTNCRVAVAHAAKDVPSDADASPEIRRLHSAAEVIQAVARHVLHTKHRLPVSRYSDE